MLPTVEMLLMFPMRLAVLLVSLLTTPVAAGCLEGGGEPPGESSTPPSATPVETDAGRGAGEPAAPSFVRVYVENNARRDATFVLRLDGGEGIVIVAPYDGSQPNVRIAYEGNRSSTTLTLDAEEAGSGATHRETFPLGTRTYVIVAFNNDGTLDAWSADEEPLFD